MAAMRPDPTEQIERDLGAIRRALRVPLEGAIARGGLTVPQMAVVQILVRHDGISLKDLSHAVSLAHSTVSGIIDRLEDKGMLERRADPADGRITRLYPSATIRDFVTQELPALTKGPLQRALDRTTRAERARIGEAIARLRQLLDETGTSGRSAISPAGREPRLPPSRSGG
jgi:DNA-binding MarR family transcriptional regulator